MAYKTEQKRISKRAACDLALRVIGTRKIDHEDELGYYFKIGEIMLRVMNLSYHGRQNVFEHFDFNGKRYEKPVYDCTIWVGNYDNKEHFYTLDTMEEIYFSWKDEEE